MKTRPPLDKGGLQGGLERDLTDPGAARLLSLRATPPKEGIFKGVEEASRAAWNRSVGSQIATVRPLFESLLNPKSSQLLLGHFKLGLKTLAGSISQQMVEE